MRFTPKPVPERWDTRWLSELFINLRKAVNELSEHNFPNPLTGDILIRERSLSLNRMTGELGVGTLLALAQPYTTTSTSLVQIGPMLYIDPYFWPVKAEQLELVITAGPASVNGDTVVELHDTDGPVVSITTNAPGYGRYKKAFDRLPGSEQLLSLKIKTTNSSVTAGILGASVVCKLV